MKKVKNPIRRAVAWTSVLGLQSIALSALAAAPSEPSALTAVSASSSRTQLTWKDNSTDELGFVVQRKTSTTPFMNVATLAANTTAFQDSGLAANTKYTYRVGAYNKGNNDKLRYAYSTAVKLTTPASPPPVQPPSTPPITPTTTTTLPAPTTTVPAPTTTTTLPKPPTTTTTLPPTTTTTLPPIQTPPVTPTADAITDVRVQNTASVDQTNVPVTFGQVFALGQLKTTESVVGVLSNGTKIALQVNVKATHPDGSVRHAIISALIPQLTANQTLQMQLVKSTLGSVAAVAPTQMLGQGFTARVSAMINGIAYSASADALLKAGTYKQWLSGPIANEWLVSTPLKDAQGNVHPHLSARFDVRSYSGMNRAKVDVVLENSWAYEPNPQNITYDVDVQIGGKSVYSKAALEHFTQTRWKKTFWWGTPSTANVKLNTAYLINTKAVPNYDQSIPVTEASLESFRTRFAGAAIEPMGSGIGNAYMPTTGGRPDIGLLPAWGASYLLSMDSRAQVANLGMGDLAGSWSAHYRDIKTDQPISLYDYPYMTIVGHAGDTTNPVTKKQEAFPVCGGVCTNKNTVDISHQPNMAYLPYLVTGDHYYLEELQFYGMFDAFSSNPGYRQNIKGLLSPEQLRGQGWGLRTIAEAAYITPDQDRLKAHFMGIVDSNLDWYNANYTNNPSANQLGVIINGYSVTYNNNTGMAPWMDDFFTQAIGHIAELGFAKAKPLLVWKAKFQIGRMTAPGFCWILGASYTLTVRDSLDGAIYPTLAEAYQKSFTDPLRSLTCNSPEMAANLTLKVGEMTGYSSSTEGYPSNYQPALAYSVDSGATDGAKAWQIFMNRTVKPAYGSDPQFSIVPRK